MAPSPEGSAAASPGWGWLSSVSAMLPRQGLRWIEIDRNQVSRRRKLAVASSTAARGFTWPTAHAPGTWAKRRARYMLTTFNII